MRKELSVIYSKLYASFGPQYWWPAESRFEVMVGAILTQNTSWQNVKKAIGRLKKNKVLSQNGLYKLRHNRLARLIRPAGYYNIKAKRLKNLLSFLENNKGIRAEKLDSLRQRLLAVNGIGPETADSILLYALDKPAFVIDAYTKRIFSRHGFFGPQAPYEEAQKFFMQNLKKDVQLFNEFHALIVRLGKYYCLKNKPKCAVCPLKDLKRIPDA